MSFYAYMSKDLTSEIGQHLSVTALWILQTSSYINCELNEPSCGKLVCSTKQVCEWEYASLFKRMSAHNKGDMRCQEYVTGAAAFFYTTL